MKSQDLLLIVEEIDQLQRNKETAASNPPPGNDQQKQSVKEHKQSKPDVVQPPGKEQEQKPDAQPTGKEQEQSKPDAQTPKKEQQQGNEPEPQQSDEGKEERRKRLHARYMRFSRSLASASLNMCSLAI